MEEEYTDEELVSSSSLNYSMGHGLLQQELEDDASIVGDIAKGAWRGTVEAVDETLKFGREVADGAIEYGSFGALEGFNDDTLEDSIVGVDDWTSKPVTGAGKFTEAIVQFGLGFVGAGKLRWGVKLLAAKHGKVGLAKKLDTKDAGFWKQQGLYGADSAIASGVVLDPYEDTLAELAEEYDIAPTIADALANDLDDTKTTMRIKNVVEDMGLTVLTVGLINIVKAVRRGMKPSEAEEAFKALQKKAAQETKPYDDLDSAVPADDIVLRDHIKFVTAAAAKNTTVRNILEHVEPDEIARLAKELGDENVQKLHTVIVETEKSLKEGTSKVTPETLETAKAKFKDELAKALEDSVNTKTAPYKDKLEAAKAQAARDAPEPKATETVKETTTETVEKGTAGKVEVEEPRGTLTPAPLKFGTKEIQEVQEGLAKAAKLSDEEFKAYFDEVINKYMGLSSKYWKGLEHKERMEHLLTDILTPAIKNLGKTGEMKFQVVRKAAIERAASLQGISPEQLSKMIDNDTDNVYKAVVNLMVHEAHTSKAIDELLSLADDIEKVSTHSSEVTTSLGKQAAFANKIQEVLTLVNAGGKLEEAFGRALVFRKAGGIDVATYSQSKLNKVLDPLGIGSKKSKVKQDKLVETLRAARDNKQAQAKAIKNFGRYTGVEKFIAAITEMWRGILLSSSATQVSNLVSNVSETFLIPIERLIGSAPPFRVRWKDGHLGYDPTMKEAMDAAWGHFHYMNEGFTHALKATKHAFAHERQSLDPYRGGMIETPGPGMANLSHAEMNANSAFQMSSGNWGLSPESVMGTMVDTAGKTGRMSFRFLGASDELIKFTTYWAALKNKYAREMGKRINTKEISREDAAKELDQMMKDHFEPDGFTPKMGKDGNLLTDADALAMARDVTHTKPAYEGSIVDTVQKAVNSNPVLGLFLPFIRTPSDLINKAYQRTPGLGMLSKRWQADMMNPDPLIRAQAKGRQIMGTAFVGAAYMYAVDGNITGRGPDDPRANKIWARTNQRNSILVDGQWVSYNKADPSGILLGMIANAVEASKNEALTEGNDALDTTAAIITAVTDTIGEKSALQGIANMATLFSPKVIGKEAQTATFLENHLASWVPSIFSQIDTAISDTTYLKEADGLIEKLMRKSPWHSGELADRYDWISGERVELPTANNWGFPAKKKEHDWVLTEMANLGHGFSGPTHSFDGVDLTSHQFSEWSKLMGTIRLPEYYHKTLMGAIKSEMRSLDYDYDPDRIYIKVEGEDDPEQVALIKRVIRRYKAAAKTQLLRNNPDLVPNKGTTSLFG